MNLRQTVNGIRAGVVRSRAQRGSQIGPEAALGPLHSQITKLVLSYEQLCCLRNAVGRMPSSPNTMRAKVGSVLVRVVQRMLFWYTPQIQRFQNATAMVAENVCSCMEAQLAATQRLFGELAGVRSEMRLHGVGGPVSPLPREAAQSSGDLCFEHLQFSLQNRMRGTEEECELRLRDHLAAIDSLTPPIPDGAWLDIGCGRGDWLGIVACAGHEAIGLDDNRAAVAHCTGSGLKAMAGDPLAYLRRAPDAHYAVISVLHALDRYSFRYASELIRESVRALKPDGVFLLESANPGSLIGEAEGAWRDPGQQRSPSASTIGFLLEYFGLHTIVQFDLDAFPEERRLPFGELDFIKQLNSQLYGPRAYAMLARRPRGVADSREDGTQDQPQ
jgi:SAM-dependent methyltransferase